MKKQRSASRRNRRGRGSGDAGVEWVGGRLTSPFYVTEPTPVRPEMILWVEQPSGLVVGYQIIDPSCGPPISLAESLEQAMRAPIAGPPRRPARIRIPDARFAAELRRAVPEIEVVVAPSPELEDVLRAMAEALSGDEDQDSSYLEHGRVPAGVIEALFAAAQTLYVVAPWKRAADSQVLRLDIPALGVEGACISIIGALGESLGFIIFPSLIAYDSFRARAIGEVPHPRDDMPDLGCSMLSLNFERGADLPRRMRREATEHGWPVAGPNAYPFVRHSDRDGLLRPLTEQDVRIVAACTASLAAFCSKHKRLFERELFEPICESWFDDDDLEVRFTVPYEASGLFAIDDPALAPIEHAPKVGRNSPCPCGSGKKYKKCCLRRDEAGRDVRAAPAKVHEVDQRLIAQMLGFAGRRFGERRPANAFGDPEAEPALLLPWLAYHVPIEGRPLVQWFTEEHGQALSRTEARWLEAQQAAWLSVWEVSAVEPGRSLMLEDLLTGEKREVGEVSGSQTLARREAILARIVDWDETSLISGCHSRPLPPLEAAEVVRRVRSRLRRKRAIPVERLRDEKTGRWIIQGWEEAVDELDARFDTRPRLTNTDGEPLLLTVDRFEFEPGRRREVERRLAALPGVEAPAPDDVNRGFLFLRRGDANDANEASESEGSRTVIGRAEIANGSLRLETNSAQRADALRRELEEACGEVLRHRGRDHTDPLVAAESLGARDPAPDAGGADELPRVEAAALIREFKTQHYADWPNEPLPALGGKTPRESVKTKAGRAAVDVLLKDIERHESRLPEDEQFDFAPLRRKLGLEAGPA